MNEIQLIADQIVSGYRDGAWPGVSARDLLHGLTPTQAADHPIVGVHSAWEIALHLGFWHDAVCRRLNGEAIDYEVDEDWPTPPAATEANWRAALQGIDRSHAALVETVRRLTPSRLTEIVPGKDFTVYFMLHGVPQHDLYHAGQIKLLCKVMERNG